MQSRLNSLWNGRFNGFEDETVIYRFCKTEKEVKITITLGSRTQKETVDYMKAHVQLSRTRALSDWLNIGHHHLVTRNHKYTGGGVRGWGMGKGARGWSTHNTNREEEFSLAGISCSFRDKSPGTFLDSKFFIGLSNVLDDPSVTGKCD